MKKIILIVTLTVLSLATYSQCASGTFGNFPPPFTNVASFGANNLLGTSHILSSQAMLTGLGYRGNGTGATMRMAIYTDVAGLPANLVAYTNLTTVGTGTANIPVITPTLIPAGTYWIMANYSGGTGMGHVNNTTAVNTKTVAYIALPVTSVPPATAAWLTYTYRDFDYWGEISTTTVNLVVTPSSTLVCSGTPLLLTASGSTSYTWNTNATTTTISVNPTSTSNYTVRSDLGTCTAVAVGSVSVSPEPTINVSNGAICPGGTFTISPSGASNYVISGGSATVSPVNTTTYSISGSNAIGCPASNTAICTVTIHVPPVIGVNSGSICSGHTFVISPSGASTYTYTSGSPVVSPANTTTYGVTGTGANGCVSSNTAISSVTVELTPTISVSGGTVCAGDSFTMSPAGAATYTYQGGSAVVTPAGNSSYTISGTSAQGCVATGPAVCQVTVHTLPVISVNNGTTCAGKPFTLTPSGAGSYTFSEGHAVVSPTISTSYTVTGSNTQGCIGQGVSSITVSALPTVTATSNRTMVCTGKPATLTPGGASSYSWAIPPSSGSLSTVLVVSPSVTTIYTVTGTDIKGCSQSYTISHKVTDCTGLNEWQPSVQLSVYPNPNTGQFTIRSGGEEIQLTLINELGQTVLQLELNGMNGYTASVSNLANGIYFATGISNTGVVLQKIVVNK